MRYTKEIVKANVPYRLGNGNVVKYSPDELLEVVRNTKALMGKGYRVPAPWEHNRDITLSSLSLKKGKIVYGNDGLLDNPLKNAGYWEDFYVENGSLVGVLEVGNPEIQSKIGNEVRDVSLYIRDQYKDPFGGEHGKVLMHVCLTGQPVAMGTSNFERQEVCLSQSMMDSPESVLEADEGLDKLKNLLKVLSQKLGLELPEYTTLDTLVEYLTVAADNYQPKQEATPPALPGKSPKDEEREIDEPPEGSKKKADKSVGGVIMSQEVEALKAELELLKKDRDSMSLQQEVLLSQVSQSKLSVYETRIGALIAAQAISQEHADKFFKPLMAEKTASGCVMLSQKTELELERLVTLAEIMAKNIKAREADPRDLLLSQFAPQGSVGVTDPTNDQREAVNRQLEEFRKMVK